MHTEIKIGMIFNHPRVQNPNGTPMEYTVTKIYRGAVYIKAIEGGGKSYIPQDKFLEWVNGNWKILYRS